MVACHALPNKGSAPTTISIAADGTLWFTESAGNRIGRMNPRWHGTGGVSTAAPGQRAAHHRAGRRRQHVVLRTQRQPRGPRHTRGVITEFDIPTPASQPRAISLGADGNIWFGMFAAGKIGRITPAGVITEFTIPTPNSGPRALATGPDGNVWVSEYRASKIARITPQGVITEFVLPRPHSGPGDITAGADGAMWFVELNGADGEVTDGNRVGRITMDGKVSEFALPTNTGSPVNIAVGPDRNAWYTKGNMLGRVTPGASSLSLLPGKAVAEWASVPAVIASRRQRLTDRLWFADGAQDRLCYLQFRP